MLAWFLAVRYLRRRRSAWLSVAAVTFTVFIPVVILGVMQGWVSMTAQQVRGSESDLTARSFNQWDGLADPDGQLAEALSGHSEVTAVAPFVYAEAVVQNHKAPRRTMFSIIDGIDFEREAALNRITPETLHVAPTLELDAPPIPAEIRGSGFITQDARAHMALQASFHAGPLLAPWELKTAPGVIVGRELSYINGGLGRHSLLGIGQIIQLLIPDGKGGTIGKLNLEISDTIGTGVYEVDRTTCWLPLEQAQRLTAFDARRNNGDALISGYRLSLAEPDQWQSVKQSLQQDLFIRIDHWTEIRKSLVENTLVYRNLMFLVMILVQFLCIFIIYSVFSTLVSEKRHDIGVLLGLGAKPRVMASTFLCAGLIACLGGGLLGWILGWIVLALLNPFCELIGFQIFPQEFIFTAETPISFDPIMPLIFVSVAALTGLIATALPARQAAKIEPIASIREVG